MKISFDLDGTLLDVPALKKIFIQLQQANEVGILTGHAEFMKKGDLEILNGMDIKPDFLIYHPVGFGRDEESSSIWKSQMIKKNKIDYHFDDYNHLINK